MATKKSAAKAPAKTEAKIAAKKSAPAKTAAKPAGSKTAGKSASKATVTHQQIADLAHKYFTERGQHHGSHVNDWLRAEKELNG